MAKNTASDPENAADIMSRIGDRYLLLIRENYLDDPLRDTFREFVVDTLRGLMQTGRFSCVYDLACSRDWREAVVGLHFAIALASPAFDFSRAGRAKPKAHQLLSAKVADRCEIELSERELHVQALTIRPTFLLLALQMRRNAIVDFLTRERELDEPVDIYAAAVVSEIITRGMPQFGENTSTSDSNALRDRVMSRLDQSGWGDEREFARSQQRFLRSWHYWVGQDAEPKFLGAATA
jgi:hypothetical protein